jgi:nucleotide-binding universal stress UspA family protein
VSIFPTRILLAIDGSDEADLAARKAVDLADATGSELYLVYAGLLPNFLMKDLDTLGFDRALYDEIERESLEILWRLSWRVKVAGGTVVGAHLRMGAVAEEIVALADQLEVDLIVVGSRGLRGIRRALAGSVSESVFRHAHCPVMVVRAKDKPPSPRGGRPRVRRVLSQNLGQASHALAQQ